MNKPGRLIFASAEGIGNCIQTIPVIRTLKEVLGYEVDYWHAFSGFNISKIIPYVDNWFVGREIANINQSLYKGMVSTFWTRNHMSGLRKIPLLSEIHPLSMYRSEVDTYMQIARDLGAKEEGLIWHGNCDYSIKKGTGFDVVVVNGYNRVGSANWSVKGYPHFGSLVELLKDKGFSVASIGGGFNEYIKGTKNRTGLNIKDSFGTIKQSKLLISNDTGMYHAANALEVPNIVIFTASSVAKNFDSRFHKFSTIIAREDLDCRRDCQEHRKWGKTCKVWECQNVDPEYVAEKALEILHGN